MNGHFLFRDRYAGVSIPKTPGNEMSRHPFLQSVVIATVALLALAGCAATAAPSLEGSQWRLSEWTLSSLAASDFNISAAFANGEISGRSGVNAYSGPVTLGADGSFAIGRLRSTLMAGPEPAMRAESAYLTLLGQARTWKIANGKLTLYDAGGNESLIFGRAGP
jgi:heat shock protein HslJ